MSADHIVYCLERVSYYRDFERLCSDLLAGADYPAIDPLGSHRGKRAMVDVTQSEPTHRADASFRCLPSYALLRGASRRRRHIEAMEECLTDWKRLNRKATRRQAAQYDGIAALRTNGCGRLHTRRTRRYPHAGGAPDDPRRTMSTIRLTERVATDDVVDWQLPACTVIRFGKRGSFEPGAHGLALAMLAGLSPAEQDVLLDCEFDEPTNKQEVEATLFSGAFGFALTRLVKRIHFAGRPATAQFKSLLSAVYREGAGILGVGSSVSVVCPDPVFQLPPALLTDENSDGLDSYPPPSAFTTLLRNVVKEMGFRRLLGSMEESRIVEFVYESLRNSLEHGMPSDATRRSRSTRALIVEKVVLKASDLASRRLSLELKQYLERIAETNEGSLGLGIVCLTVADQGQGIQSTLPAKVDEAEDARLARAFEPGESRKPAGVVSRGLGLPKVVSAAHHLQALIHVASGNLVVGQDFSTGESKYPKLNFQAVRRMRESFVSGTSISVFVPEFDIDLDQRTLFKR